MNWEEQLIEDCRRGDGSLHPYADYTLSGARWLLRKLRTDEAVARLADFLHEDERQETFEEHEAWCHAPECEARLSYIKFARAAIDALLGEGP